VRGTNTMLPDSIAVQWAAAVDGEFSARYSAIARRYVYLLYVNPVRPALLASKTGWFHAPLALEAMREAATVLLGRHDFSAFRSSECQAKTPVRTLASLTMRSDGPYIVFDLRADAFLHHMVRNLVGSLVYVGSGRKTVQWMAEVLASRDRAAAAPTFDAGGLYLAHVAYESRWRLPAFPRIMPFLLDSDA
jgi:tRNA pseudouridine38-40 synthase